MQLVKSLANTNFMVNFYRLLRFTLYFMINIILFFDRNI